MQEIKIELTKDERAKLEYQLFEYQGIQINFNQLFFSDFNFNDEHYNRIINTLSEKYAILQKELYKILSSHNYKNIILKTYDFFVNEGMLTIWI